MGWGKTYSQPSSPSAANPTNNYYYYGTPNSPGGSTGYTGGYYNPTYGQYGQGGSNYYQMGSNGYSQPTYGDLRKSRLTLRQLRKLRQMNDVRTFEYKEKLALIKKQYSPPPAPPAL